MKKCNRCNTEKNVNEFHKDADKKDGHTSICKICKRGKYKKNYAINKNCGNSTGDEILKRARIFITSDNFHSIVMIWAKL